MSSVLEPLQWYYEVPMEVYSLGFSSKHQLVIDMIRDLIEKKKKSIYSKFRYNITNTYSTWKSYWLRLYHIFMLSLLEDNT